MDVERYLETLVPGRPAELAAMEMRARTIRFPLLARLIGARRVFEMGSGFGCSTGWFARGVKENGGGTVFHVVWDSALSQEARGHLRTLGLDDMVQYEGGEAVGVLGRTDGPFDLIFNDIDKEGYPASLAVIAEKLRPGGLLIADNMLWRGRIFDDTDHSPGTEGVREFTRLIVSDHGWISSVVPLRDGLLLAMRR